MHSSAALLVILLLASSTVSAEMVYKCRNVEGRLVYQEAPCARHGEAVSSWNVKAVPVQDEAVPAASGNGSYVIRQRDNGHYFLDGSINGKPLTFVVDTGASTVSLPRSAAFLAHISCREQVTLQTANGSTGGCIGIIEKLKFGPFVMENVQATLIANLEQPLLGMNVLQMFRMEQDGGELKISIKN